MNNIIKKFIKHGVVTIDYPNKPINSTAITGKPEIDNLKCNLCMECQKRCPTGAIGLKPMEDENGKKGVEGLYINLDECIFCSLCQDVCPRRALVMTNNFEQAQKRRCDLRGEPVVVDERNTFSKDYEIIGRKVEAKARKIFGRSLQIREVDAGSCNGCDLEINALNSPYNDIERFGISFVASPRHADMLLVTGCGSRNMELALIKTYNAAPDPKMVVAVGACALSGGIFKDSYASGEGIDGIIPVDVYVPGCPPRPQAIIYGILKAIDRL